MTVVRTIPARIERISERGTTTLHLSAAEAIRLQSLDICSVTPAGAPAQWAVKDVRRIGSIELEDRIIVLEPKVPIRSLVYMASGGGAQLRLRDASLEVDEDPAAPVAFVESLLDAIESATRGGLLKGYRLVEESSTVMRGRWDVVRQIKRRPGLPNPVEITFDEFTEDIRENRLLAGALITAMRFPGLPPALLVRLRASLARFAEVTAVGADGPSEEVVIDRRNQHYQPALALADWILRGASAASATGLRTGPTFLVEPAALFEAFVGRRLAEHFSPFGIDVELQASGWRLDTEGLIRMRPDIVLRHRGVVVGVADTKYKHYRDDRASPPNDDVYQALAYATAAGLDAAHLIYVAGDMEPSTLRLEATGTRIVVHAVDLAGNPRALERAVRRLARDVVAHFDGGFTQPRPTALTRFAGL